MQAYAYNNPDHVTVDAHGQMFWTLTDEKLNIDRHLQLVRPALKVGEPPLLTGGMALG